MPPQRKNPQNATLAPRTRLPRVCRVASLGQTRAAAARAQRRRNNGEKTGSITVRAVFPSRRPPCRGDSLERGTPGVVLFPRGYTAASDCLKMDFRWFFSYSSS